MQKVSFTKNSLGSKSGNNAVVLFVIPASLFTLPPFSSKENSIVCTAFSITYSSPLANKNGLASISLNSFFNLKSIFGIFTISSSSIFLLPLKFSLFSLISA